MDHRSRQSNKDPEVINAENEIEVLSNTIFQLQGKIDVLDDLIKNHEGYSLQYIDLQYKISELTKQVEIFQGMIIGLKTEITEFIDQKAKLVKEIEDLSVQVIESRKLAGDVEKNKKMILSQQTDMARFHDEHEDRKKRAKVEINTLKNSLTETYKSIIGIVTNLQ